MIKIPPFWRGRRGSGIFLLFMIVVILMPILAIMAKMAVQQSRMALKDRNIRTAREMAESITYDYMQTFSSDWSKNHYDDFYSVHNIAAFSDVGKAQATITKNLNQQTMGIWTVAEFTKGGMLKQNQYAHAKKGVNALFAWSSDAFRFEMVSPTHLSFIDDSINKIDVWDTTAFVK